MTSSLRALFVACFLFPLGACGPEPEPEPVSAGGEESASSSGPEAPPPGRGCGGIAGLACPEGEWCDYGEHCRMPDAMGTCRPVQRACTRDYRPVCGCDDRTYPNACTANAAGVSLLHDGPCEGQGASAGGPQAPCGSRGLAPCPDGLFCDYPLSARCGETDHPGVCRPRPEMCTEQHDPVCGCDGRTYGNTCAAASAGTSVRRRGECR